MQRTTAQLKNQKNIRVIREQNQGGDLQGMSLRGTWELGAKWESMWPPFPEQSKWSESAKHSTMDYTSPWNSPGQNTGVGSLSLLQGIFPTQGLNPGLSHCRQILYQLRHEGSPRILEWVAYPFSIRSSWPRKTQESNQGLLHCRWILYQLSYQGSPDSLLKVLSQCVSTRISFRKYDTFWSLKNGLEWKKWPLREMN